MAIEFPDDILGFSSLNIRSRYDEAIIDSKKTPCFYCGKMPCGIRILTEPLRRIIGNHEYRDHYLEIIVPEFKVALYVKDMLYKEFDHSAKKTLEYFGDNKEEALDVETYNELLLTIKYLIRFPENQIKKILAEHNIFLEYDFSNCKVMEIIDDEI